MTVLRPGGHERRGKHEVRRAVYVGSAPSGLMGGCVLGVDCWICADPDRAAATPLAEWPESVRPLGSGRVG